MESENQSAISPAAEQSAPAEPTHAVAPASLNPSTDPSESLQDQVRGQMDAVRALENDIRRLPPAAQQRITPDLEAIKSSLMLGQPVDSAAISRVTQAIGDEEGKEVVDDILDVAKPAMAGAGLAWAFNQLTGKQGFGQQLEELLRSEGQRARQAGIGDMALASHDSHFDHGLGGRGEKRELPGQGVTI
jgi:hypothetical protein